MFQHIAVTYEVVFEDDLLPGVQFYLITEENYVRWAMVCVCYDAPPVSTNQVSITVLV